MSQNKINMIMLYQLADSTLPTGGFVFSSGLESIARLGWLRNSDDMYNYLNVQLEQACTAEIPFINSLVNNIECNDTLRKIMNYYDAFIQIEEIRSASIRQARSWLDILVEIDLSLKDISKSLLSFSGILHYTPAFTISLATLNIELNMIKELYLYVILRDQISAAVRLGLTGPTKGAGILSQLLRRTEKYINKYSNLEYTDAFRAAPMLEIAQAKHHELYTKLFQN